MRSQVIPIYSDCQALHSWVVDGNAVHFGDNGFWCNPRQSQLQDTKATLSWALSGKSGAEREREGEIPRGGVNSLFPWCS